VVCKQQGDVASSDPAFGTAKNNYTRMPPPVVLVIEDANNPIFGDLSQMNSWLGKVAFNCYRSQHLACVPGINFRDHGRKPICDSEKGMIGPRL
jgi:hypothetical protein